MTISAYAVHSPGQSLRQFQYEPKELGPWNVEVKISHCGICHSDIHLIDDDWSISSYPLVPGHEIIGIVTELGDNVRDMAMGQRVGIGWQRSACLECDSCLKGEETHCYKSQATCVGNHGGFAESIRADSRFAFPIPENMDSETAAPLLCGGITVYSPLRIYDIRPEMKVGVVGLGGLGHLALQFAHAYGCEVTAFSSTPEKESEARDFGASQFCLSNDHRQLEKLAGTLDFIISTVFVDLDWAAYLKILRPKGRLCLVGAIPHPITIPTSPLVLDHKSICGSAIGSRWRIKEMLEFASRHNIKAKTEAVPMDQVNTAIDKVRKNQSRYRMVLVNS